MSATTLRGLSYGEGRVVHQRNKWDKVTFGKTFEFGYLVEV
jgi:hypothetical protein